MPRTLGVEEEFHVVDLKTRRLTARAPELLDVLSNSYVAELQRCVVEMNSGVVHTLDGLRADLQSHRRVLVDAAARLGMGVVAAGAVPLSVPAEMQVTQTARYRQMLADYQLLAREQLICGTQVHVGVDDRDESVAVANRVTPYLPTLLALSASSPFWADGSDTGYASARMLVWQRWPTTGPAPPVSSAAEYDRLVDDLVASGVITDAGMVYFDVRPALAAPTLELRVCDSCPSVDTIVLIAGLFRAVVEREVEALRVGRRGGRGRPVAGPGRVVAGGPLRAGGRARRHQRPQQPGRRRGRHRPGAVAAPAARGGGGLADDHRADPASVDLRHIGSPSAQGLASPRPPHRRRRSAARRDGGQLVGRRGGRDGGFDSAVR